MTVDEIEKYRKKLVFISGLFSAFIIFILIFIGGMIPKFKYFVTYIFINILLIAISVAIVAVFVGFLNKLYSKKFKKFLSFRMSDNSMKI